MGMLGFAHPATYLLFHFFIKRYLTDTGLACYHARLSTPTMLGPHPFFGSLFETAMVQELRKQVAAQGVAVSWYHWRSAGGLRWI
jgi:predicted AAA+ superfamily ATPase